MLTYQICVRTAFFLLQLNFWFTIKWILHVTQVINHTSAIKVIWFFSIFSGTIFFITVRLK
jgi:hypothetical protein